MRETARLLVIDDDESVTKAYTAALEAEGYAVEVAQNGKEAIQKSDTRFYNLALIDIRLPDMDGVKLLTAMRETTPKMVKIIITGYPSVQNAIVAVNKDANAYLLKPLNIDNVLNTIEEQLKKQRETRKYSEEKVTEFIETRARELEEETPTTNKKLR